MVRYQKKASFCIPRFVNPICLRFDKTARTAPPISEEAKRCDLTTFFAQIETVSFGRFQIGILDSEVVFIIGFKIWDLGFFFFKKI